MKPNAVKIERILVSECLLGQRCRYRGEVLPAGIIERVRDSMRGKYCVPACPGQM
jgi:uncharacterized protein YbbK (DUF523 family)